MTLLHKYSALLKLLDEKMKSDAEYSLFLSFLEDIKTQTKEQITTDGINLTADDLENLPPEMLAQLGLSDSDYVELDIVRIINGFGGMASLDKILVNLYREKNEIFERTGLNAKLYRMIKKGLIYGVPGRKGVYSTRFQGN